MTISKIFFFFCLSFVGGIFLSSFFQFLQLLMLVFLILGIILISVLWRHKNIAVIGFCILFLVLGVWRQEKAELEIMNNELRMFNDLEQEVALIGLVSVEPDVRDNHTKLTIGNIQLIEAENGSRSVEGKILVTAEKYPGYKYGDELKIKGLLKTPAEFDEFSYKNYLAKDGIFSVMYYPEIELIDTSTQLSVNPELAEWVGKNQGNFIFAEILDFKDKLREVIYQNLSPPESSILAAIILGDKRQISQEWKGKLNYAGLRHLTAISGMHVAILTVILMSFLIGLGFWRRHSFYFSIVLITFFIIMIGLQASAIRAGIMGGLFLFAQHLGRMNISSRAIVFAATLMLAHNPLLLKLDVGFQLSFLAMLGIIYFVPIFQFFLHKVPDFFQLKNIFVLTLSAQIFTLPILIYNFGYFSTVAPLTNILIVPLLPLIMGLGLIFVLSGTIWNFFGWFFSLPVWLLLTYLVKIVDWFSGFSFSAFVLEISWVWLLIFYLIAGVFIWRFNEKRKLKFLQY